MRLLLRRNSHRTVDGALQIASSPDTPRREQWQWHVRVLPDAARTAPAAPAGPAAVDLPRGDGSTSLVCASVDPAAVTVELSPEAVDEPRRLERPESELVVLVVGSGVVRVEGRHLLTELDAMVIAGDDPLVIQLEPASAEPASLAVARFSSVDAAGVAWVP